MPPYEGPERRRKAATPEEQFKQDVDGLTRRVLTAEVSLAEIRFNEGGEERERIIRAVQERVVRLFAKIKQSQRALKDTSVVPAIRKRLLRLYNLQDGQLGTPGEMVAVVPPVDGAPHLNLEREFFFFGKLYLSYIGEDYFEIAREAIVNKFIMRCENERQQERVLEIAGTLQKSNLAFMGSCNGFSVIQLDSEVLDRLNIASLLTDEDFQGVRPAGASPERRDSFVDMGRIDNGWDE